jgi:hypothetical protein
MRRIEGTRHVRVGDKARVGEGRRSEGVLTVVMEGKINI